MEAGTDPTNADSMPDDGTGATDDTGEGGSSEDSGKTGCSSLPLGGVPTGGAWLVLLGLAGVAARRRQRG